ncbi:hypothetical protein LV779_12240 [Streptomyces thinghirensis]|nr:hypothetical protein [Streptomyces thinghirensis]
MVRQHLRQPDPLQGYPRLDAYARPYRPGTRSSPRARGRSSYDSDGYKESALWKTEKLSGLVTLVLGSEASWVSTNDTALYGLAAIETRALLGRQDAVTGT